MSEDSGEIIELPAIDEDPDVWAETEHPQATEEEVELGNLLGEEIQIDADDDDGGDIIESYRSSGEST